MKNRLSRRKYGLLLCLLTDDWVSGLEARRRYNASHWWGIGLGTFYFAMSELTDDGYVEMREDVDQDGKLRLFKIRPKGVNAIRFPEGN